MAGSSSSEFAVEIRTGSLEEARALLKSFVHTKTRNTGEEITNSLNSEGLISLSNVDLAMTSVEGNDAGKRTPTNTTAVSTPAKELKTKRKNEERKERMKAAECRIRSGELVILNKLAQSLRRKYTDALSMDNTNIQLHVSIPGLVVLHF